MGNLTPTEEEVNADIGKYLEAAERGETVTVMKGDRPVARITPAPRLKNIQQASDFLLQVEADAGV